MCRLWVHVMGPHVSARYGFKSIKINIRLQSPCVNCSIIFLPLSFMKSFSAPFRIVRLFNYFPHIPMSFSKSYNPIFPIFLTLVNSSPLYLKLIAIQP
uniref:Uncharacterized protein n=1 Tax=Arundo donax TaxID=35708 RepID=A0A0A9H146_ARUDO